MKHYIRERKLDWSGSEPIVLELAYYGPFEASEIQERVNDTFADFMAEDGKEIEGVLLSLAETSAMYINPREFWMSQLSTLTYILEPKSA